MAEPGKKSVWNAQSHEDLLLCLIDNIKPGKDVVNELVQRMETKGHTFSFHAIKYICSKSFFYSQLFDHTAFEKHALTAIKSAHPEAPQEPRYQRHQHRRRW